MFERMKLGNKIVAGFAAVTLIAAVMGFVGVSGIRSTMMNLDEISDNRLPSVQSLLIMSESMYKVAVAERGLINRRMAEPQFRKAQYEFAERAMKRADAAWKVYESLPQGREEAAMWKEFVPRWEAWKKSHQPVLAGSLEKDRLMSSGVSLDDSRMEAVDEQVFKASQESRLRFLEIEQPLAKLVELNIALAKEASKSADADAARARALMIGAIVVTLLMAAAIGFYLRRNIAGILKGLVEECQRLSEAAVKGNLATRGDAQRINFEFRCVLEGMNRTLDAVIGPLNVAGEYVDRISKGDIPPKITDDYQGDFNEIKSNLNTCIDAVNALVADANMLSAAALEGKLATRADASRHQGDFRRVVDGVNHTLDAVIGPLNVAAEYVDRISKGDIPPKIVDSYQGDFNEMKNNLNTCIDAVSALVADARMLSVAAVEGRLATRADASRHQGDFRQVVDGVNQTLDAVIGPLNVAAEYVDRISKGDIPPKIVDSYQGDFNEIKNNLNTCIDAVNALVADARMLSVAAVEGRLATRADASRHQGDFRRVVDGVNQTLDAVIGPLNVAGEYVDRISKGDIPPKITDSYQGDFNEIKNNLNTCIDAVNALVADADMLSAAALEGKLATRADASRHQGDFRRVVDGVNRTLDAVIGPLNVAAEYAERISKGDIPPKITDSYQGDFNEIKNNLNVCIDAVSALIADARMLSVAAVEGRLATRADGSRHQGDFRQVVDGVNRTLDAVIGPLNVAAEYVDRISKGDIPTPITDDYRGDFNELKINLNVLISAMGTIAEVAEKISHGDLAVEVRPRSGQDRLMLSLQNMVAVLKELASSAELIAAGDLTLTVRPASERDVMGNAFVAMVENLRSIVGNVSAGTASIATASRQIAAGSADMAQRTEQQAASLEETAASMEELTSTVKQNAENSQQANQLAIAASDVAVKGGAVIGKVVTTMDSISDSSKKISDIIGVIDGIAFQTNILALNAAVEAARAGEQGRGFAVVAGEVRNLAQRSAAAAKEIKSLIGDSVDKVGSGSKLVGEAGQTMQEIVASIKRVTEIVAEISAASVEQSCGIEQINIAITSMDEMTQQNSSIVQQSAAAADSLQEQAGLLVEAVNGFKLVGGQRGAAGGARMEGFAASPGVRQQPPPLEKVKKANGYHKTMTASGRKAQGAGQAPPILAMAVGDDADWNGYS